MDMRSRQSSGADAPRNFVIPSRDEEAASTSCPSPTILLAQSHCSTTRFQRTISQSAAIQLALALIHATRGHFPAGGIEALGTT
jgi:hypothetical protein